MSQILICEVLFADDCAVMAHRFEHIQKLIDGFPNAAKCFDLTVSLKKTIVMLQLQSGFTPSKRDICVSGTALISSAISVVAYHKTWKAMMISQGALELLVLHLVG